MGKFGPPPTYIILRTIDMRLLHQWMALWDDIVRCEVIRVFNGEQAKNAMLRTKIADDGGIGKDGNGLDELVELPTFLDRSKKE
jgi:hypothetical protein